MLLAAVNDSPHPGRVVHSPHPAIPNQRVSLGCFSAQDDATVKCWGTNTYGQLGLGDTSERGDDANGPCPSLSLSLSLSFESSTTQPGGTNPNVLAQATRRAAAL